ncbi:MAG: RES domain-containing protein, partial [Alicycliphilus sp.]|nr:RES domain-containing protein [Alicycliphilus sp.]
MTLAADWERFWLEPGIGAQSMLAWRGVEAQHVVSTMRLVDSAAEQDLLEQLLEASKPALPATRQPRHYLLLTPFRYRPHHPSRFRPAHARGQWYGAEA